MKKMRYSGQDRIKSDQRILGDGDFVMEILSESEADFSRKYRLKARGLNFEKVIQKVASPFNVEKDYIIGKGRQKDRVAARDLPCYWCAIELEIPMAELARRLNITLAAVSYAVKGGENAAKEESWRLDEWLI